VDEAQRHKLLRRGVTEIIVESEFLELLGKGKPLRLKMGFDPSAPDLHMGHAVGLRKLRQLQELGHKVVVIVGDWTAQIGDPSGRSATRPMLTQAQVLENAESYLAQFFKIVDRDRTETRLQSDWFGPFSLADVIKLTSRFTVAQILARDDFAKRYAANQPIAVTELLYPLLQAYDSIAIDADVEFGGTDQRFNLLMGRDLQEMMGQRAQQCFLMPLLPGTDGVQKMSKSLNNYIGVDDAPNEMYLKTMRLPDFAGKPVDETALDRPTGGSPTTTVNGELSLILLFLECLTDVPDSEIAEMRHSLESDAVNPMEFKKRLARELVVQFHGGEAATAAERNFERTVQQGETPDDMATYTLPGAGGLAGKRLSNLLADAGLASSAGEAKRLIDQGAVSVNGETVRANVAADAMALATNDVVRVGRGRYARIIAPE
jgi:tyrosyl-tRNA synthetase